MGDYKVSADDFKVTDSYVSFSPDGGMVDYVDVNVAKYAPAVDVAVAKYAPVSVSSNVVMSGVVPATATGLALNILGTINAQDLRCDSKGDQYAQAIFNNGNGYYDKLKKSFDNIANLCNKTLKNKKIDVESIKSNLKNAKKKAMSQSQACEQRKFDMQKIYSQTKDIFAILK